MLNGVVVAGVLLGDVGVVVPKFVEPRNDPERGALPRPPPPGPKQFLFVAHGGVGTGLIKLSKPGQSMPDVHGVVQLVPTTQGDALGPG